jgi:hypothetical protein
MTEEREFSGRGTDLWRVITAPTIWAGHFLFCYVSVAVYCAKLGRAAELAPMRWTVLAASVLALAALGVLFWRTWAVRGPSVTYDDLTFEANTPEERHLFLTHVTLLLTALSAAGVVYVTIPVLILDTCR